MRPSLPTAALLAALLTVPASAGAPAVPAVPAAPAAAPAPAPTALSTLPYTVEDLFRPPQYRRYALSPNGEFLLEQYRNSIDPLPSRFDINDPAHQLLLRQSEEETYLTNLKTQQYQRISHGTRGYRTSGVIWLDDRHFVWNVTAGFGDDIDYYSERITIAVAADGSFEVAKVDRLRKQGIVFGAVPNSRDRVLFLDHDGEGLRVFAVDPKQDVDWQLAAPNRVLEGVEDLDSLAIDAEGVVRAFQALRRGTLARIYYRADRDAPWTMIHQFDVVDDERASLHGFDAGGRNLLVVTSEGTDKAVLRELDPATGKLGKILYQDPRNDLVAPVLHPVTRQLLAVTVDDAAERMEGIDPRIKTMHAKIRAQIPKYEPRIIDVDDPLAHTVIFTAEPDNPGKYSLYDVATNKILLMAHAAPWLKGRKFSRTREIPVKTRDGLTLAAFYTEPLVKKHARQPLVLMPHGGPISIREKLVFDPEIQLLASHGYAVLQVDFRGSGGYGKDFLKKGYRQWGREMQDDLVDALKHALAQGWADPERVCIYGGSYGGYAAMMGLIKTPELFQCGVTLAGVSDLSLIFKSDEVAYTPGLKELVAKQLGDPVKEREILNANSPAFLGDKIKRPVLIAHGGKDERAEPEHAYRLRASIEGAGGKVEWLFIPEGGHGFSQRPHQRQFYDKLIAFLDQHIGTP